MTSYILGIHTSTPTLALGLLELDSWDFESGESRSDRPIQSREWRLDRQMSSQLHPCLEEFFPAERWQSLVAVAVAVGPGSFTSCRMGVTVARTLGQALDIPLFGLSSLAAIAADYMDAAIQPQATEGNMTVAVRMDAKRGEWFGGIYQEGEDGVAATVGDRLWTDDEWHVVCERVTTVEAGDWEAHPPVGALLKLAAKQYGGGQRPQWATVLPFYGRKPPIHNG
ncbi:MAG: tRNA (adenosine(37)-N6)-threonylcarbamoyltransferase complex dimerization subunit type 1 TsaB [Cyanobacteria bacterium P01_A01_bin.3]